MQNKYKSILISAIKIIVLLIALLWIFSLFEPKKESMQKKSNIEAVQIYKPKGRDIVILHNYIGQVEAINQIDVLPYISGYISEIRVHGGQNVATGDILAILQQREYIAAVSAAKAEVAASETTYVNNKINYKRMLNAGNQAVSALDLDNAKTALLTSAADLKTATAKLEQAQTNLDYTYLKAPFAGVLGNINVSLGEYISPQSSSLMQLVQFDPIRVVFSVSDKEYMDSFYNNDKQNIHVKARLANGEITKSDGIIKYTSNIVDKNADSVAVYAEFTNPENKLMPNAYVEVLLQKKYQNTVLIPKQQVQMQTDGDYIYIVKDNILELKKINILGTYDNQYAVNNNFSDKEYIVLGQIDAQLLGNKVKTVLEHQ